MFSIAALAAAQLAQAGIGVAKGISQAVKAKRLAKRYKRPTYEIPKSVIEQEKLMRSLYQQAEMPGETVAMERLAGTTAGGIRAAKEVGRSPSEVLATVAGLQAQEVEGVRDLATAAAQSRLTRAGDLTAALRYKTPFEEKKFQFNKVEPYQQAKAAESALREESFKNIFKAVGGAGMGVAGMGKKSEITPQQQLAAITGVPIPTAQTEAEATAEETAAPTNEDIFASQKAARGREFATQFQKLLKMGYDHATASTMAMESLKSTF